MTLVPTDLYIALNDLGADHDEAAAICKTIPSYYAERLGPPMRSMAKRSKQRIEDLERRVTALEAGSSHE